LFIFKAFPAEVKCKAELAELSLIPYRSRGRKLEKGKAEKWKSHKMDGAAGKKPIEKRRS